MQAQGQRVDTVMSMRCMLRHSNTWQLRQLPSQAQVHLLGDVNAALSAALQKALGEVGKEGGGGRNGQGARGEGKCERERETKGQRKEVGESGGQGETAGGVGWGDEDAQTLESKGGGAVWEEGKVVGGSGPEKEGVGDSGGASGKEVGGGEMQGGQSSPQIKEDKTVTKLSNASSNEPPPNTGEGDGKVLMDLHEFCEVLCV